MLFGDDWKEYALDELGYYTVYSDTKDKGMIVWNDTGWNFYLEKASFRDETELVDMRTTLQRSIWRNG